jgi:4-hydroxy-tetrahydrodipicolinate synthase
MVRRLLEGVGVAPLTPMNNNGSCVDHSAIKSYVDFLAEKDVDGMFVLGTTGEGTSLPLMERKKTLESFLEANKGRMTVVSHCGATVLEDIIELLRHSKDCGADAAAVVSPFFFNHKQEELFSFYDMIADAVSDFPLYIYNIPSLTKNPVSVNVIAKLHEKHKNIVGLKDSSGDFVNSLSVIQALPSTFSTVVGCDAAFAPALIAGARGCVSGPGAVFPEFFVKVRDAVRDSDFDKAFDNQKSLTKLTMAVGNGANIPYMKHVLERRGLKMGGVKTPLKRLENSEIESLDSTLVKVMKDLAIDF